MYYFSYLFVHPICHFCHAAQHHSAMLHSFYLLKFKCVQIWWCWMEETKTDTHSILFSRFINLNMCAQLNKSSLFALSWIQYFLVCLLVYLLVCVLVHNLWFQFVATHTHTLTHTSTTKTSMFKNKTVFIVYT